MKDYDNDLLTLLNLDESNLGLLMSIYVSEELSLYYTTFDMDVLWDGNVYSSTDMDIGDISYSTGLSVDKFELKLNAVNLVNPTIFLENDLRNNEVIINLGGFVLADGITAAPLFSGVIDDWDLSELSLDITIVNEFILWNKKALRIPDVLCQWGFGEVECGYTPSAGQRCNKTYNQCTTYGQQDNYGGFRFINSVEENKIWWGPK